MIIIIPITEEKRLKAKALEYAEDDVSSFLCDLGWEDWMDAECIDPESPAEAEYAALEEALTKLFKAAQDARPFSEKVKAARKAAGLTQEAMAQKLQIPKRTIEDWSTGKSSPPAWTQPLIIRELERIAAEK